MNLTKCLIFLLFLFLVLIILVCSLDVKKRVKGGMGMQEEADLIGIPLEDYKMSLAASASIQAAREAREARENESKRPENFDTEYTTFNINEYSSCCLSSLAFICQADAFYCHGHHRQSVASMEDIIKTIQSNQERIVDLCGERIRNLVANARRTGRDLKPGESLMDIDEAKKLLHIPRLQLPKKYIDYSSPRSGDVDLRAIPQYLDSGGFRAVALNIMGGHWAAIVKCRGVYIIFDDTRGVMRTPRYSDIVNHKNFQDIFIDMSRDPQRSYVIEIRVVENPPLSDMQKALANSHVLNR